MKLTTNVMKISKFLLCSGVAFSMLGCATPTRVDQGKPVDPTRVASLIATPKVMASSAMRETIAIRNVSGGRDTNPMWASNVTSRDFESALEASLKDAGLLSPNRPGSKYVLIADLGKLDQPSLGPTMTATASVRYSLLDRTTNLEVFDRSLVTPFTASANVAVTGPERLRLVGEGAVRANIQQLIDALVALKVARVAGQVAK